MFFFFEKQQQKLPLKLTAYKAGKEQQSHIQEFGFKIQLPKLLLNFVFLLSSHKKESSIILRNSLSISTFFLSKITPFLNFHIDTNTAMTVSWNHIPSFLFFIAYLDQTIGSSLLAKLGLEICHQKSSLVQSCVEIEHSTNR